MQLPRRRSHIDDHFESRPLPSQQCSMHTRKQISPKDNNVIQGVHFLMELKLTVTQRTNATLPQLFFLRMYAQVFLRQGHKQKMSKLSIIIFDNFTLE